jgi:hypothetical protein
MRSRSNRRSATRCGYATRAEIKAGTPIFAIATKKPDGTFDVARLSIGRDGISPPM